MLSLLILNIIIGIMNINGLDHFTDLIKAQVNVIIDDLDIINDSENNTKIDNKNFDPTCQLTLHRTLCANPVIQKKETIEWNTRICFKWKCFNSSNYVMRVENCWTGSSHNPIYLINEDGCSMEKTMIGTPRYESSLLESYSIGWLSVRLVGVTYVRLACQIRMCHICDKKCSLLTPPKKCQDNLGVSKVPTIWNQTKLIDDLCTPPTPTPPSSHSFIKNLLKSKAAATLTYDDSIWLIIGFIVVKLFFL